MSVERLEYVIGSKTWYRDAVFSGEHPSVVEVLTVGKYLREPDNGCVWEFEFKWYNFGNGKPPVMEMQIFQDSFEVFEDVPSFASGLIKELGYDPQVSHVTHWLKKLGFKDATKKTRDK